MKIRNTGSGAGISFTATTTMKACLKEILLVEIIRKVLEILGILVALVIQISFPFPSRRARQARWR